MSHPFPITLTERQRAVLTQMASQTDEAPDLAQRAQIILLSEQRLPAAKVAKRVNLSISTVHIWRREWRSKISAIQQAAIANDNDALHEAIRHALHRGATKVKSPDISAAQLAEIMALWKEDPCDGGYDADSWTMHTATEEAIKRGIVPPTVTGNMVGHKLRKIGFPHRYPWHVPNAPKK